MPDGLKDARAGPDAMYSTELAPSRGQFEAIARIACELFGVHLENRLDATIAIARMHRSLQSDGAPRRLGPRTEISEF